MPSNQDPSAEDLYEDPPLFRMDELDEYEGEHDMNAVSLNSPPRAVGKKRQLASSPSPPPTTTRPSFSVPQKPSTSLYNSRNAFKSVPGNALHRGNKPSSAGSSTSSTVHTPSTNSLLNAFDSPTSQTSSSRPPSKTASKKRVRSDIHEQIDTLNDEIESVSTGKEARVRLKHERTIAKLGIYSQEKEHQYSLEKQREQREAARESAEHQIKLRQLEIEALQLKLELRKLGADDATK